MFSSAKNARWMVFVLMLTLLVFTASSMVFGYVDKDSAGDQEKEAVEPLPVVGSFDNLQKLVEEYTSQGFGAGESLEKSLAPVRAMNQMAADTADTAQNSKEESYSTTNIQVEGVDEADLIKTDGKYIYQLSEEELLIIKAIPANDMRVLSRIDFSDQGFCPGELYIDDRYLVVLGSNNNNHNPEPLMKSKANVSLQPCGKRELTTMAIVYDISDKENLRQLREIEIEGRYLSSRKIGSAVYFLSNRNIAYHYSDSDEPQLPFYRDSAIAEEKISVDYDKISYFPGDIYPAYIMIAGFNIDKPEEKAVVQTYLGNGENIYASVNNLYIAVSRYEENQALIRDSNFPDSPSGEQTRIYRFGLQDGEINYAAKGEVPGRILNQFSMDENEGYFRIATTTGDMWRSDEYTSKNNIYVLDGKLDIKGKLEDIAPGERIYSSRFMGDRAYLVTFRDVDPFFVIDMKNPENPVILGKLKIPGYSDYLHPYDENHIIGFGKDTIELKNGSNDDSQAYYQGLKIAIFDVSDVSKPIEMCKEIIGDRGTDSELLRNHKALLFSRDRNLLAFPLTLMERAENDNDSNRKLQRGSFTFQGAYVYHIDLDEGFKLRGRISHLEAEDYLKAGSHWYNSELNVERVLYIDDMLYSLSPRMIQAHSLSDLEHINTLPLQ